MANLNDREPQYRPNQNPNRTPVSQDGAVTGTNETNLRTGTTPRQAAFRDGYVHGRDVEQRRTELDQEVRDNDNAARGLLLGILLTGAVGLATAAYFLTQRPQPAPVRETIVVPSATPQSPAQQPTQAPVQQQPAVQERIIERDRVVPVPQTAPATPASPAPNNINITVPSTEQSAPSVPTAVPQNAPPTGSQTGSQTVPQTGAPTSAEPSSPGAGTAAPTADPTGAQPNAPSQSGGTTSNQ